MDKKMKEMDFSILAFECSLYQCFLGISTYNYNSHAINNPLNLLFCCYKKYIVLFQYKLSLSRANDACIYVYDRGSNQRTLRVSNEKKGHGIRPVSDTELFMSQIKPSTVN